MPHLTGNLYTAWTTGEKDSAGSGAWGSGEAEDKLLKCAGRSNIHARPWPLQDPGSLRPSPHP